MYRSQESDRSPTRHFVPGPERSRDFRDALGRFATGITVVTTMTPQGPQAITANSFASVSLDPPIVLWSIGRQSKRFAAFAECRYFAIHVLGAGQRELSQRFARSAKASTGSPMTSARAACRCSKAVSRVSNAGACRATKAATI